MRVYYDLHMHSCLSPCGDEDMTPNNMVNMAMLDGLQVIAISDHNTTGNAEAFLQVAEQAGITAFAGMELETAEDVHILCLFYDLESARAFDREVVAPALPPIKNRVDIFGRQLLMNAEDEIIGEDDRYLINATSITVDALPELISSYGGIAVPAHIDKSTKSILAMLGFIDESWGYTLLELSKNAPADFIDTHPELKNCYFLYDSDAHYLQDVAEEGEKNYLELPDAKRDTVWNFLKKIAFNTIK